jgi:hypothetical protein
MDIADSALIINSEIEAKMSERGIQKSDIKEVLAYAEDSEKLYIDGENRSLGKKRMENFTAYVEYEKTDDGYKILDVYSHRVSLSEDQE